MALSARSQSASRCPLRGETRPMSPVVSGWVGSGPGVGIRPPVASEADLKSAHERARQNTYLLRQIMPFEQELKLPAKGTEGPADQSHSPKGIGRWFSTHNKKG
jgi:hypothetical protein